MRRASYTISLLATFINLSEQRGTFRCTHIVDGQLVTGLDLNEQQARSCYANLKNCSCNESATKCAFGPDKNGKLLTDVVVPPGRAENCDPNYCICTSHKNYQLILASRIAEYGVETEDIEIIVETETEEEVEPITETEEEEIIEELEVRGEKTEIGEVNKEEKTKSSLTSKDKTMLYLMFLASSLAVILMLLFAICCVVL